jgi:hypothetical protein
MIEVGLRKGMHAKVSVRIGDEDVADVLLYAISDVDVKAVIYTDGETDLVAIFEALLAAARAAEHKCHMGRLKQIIEERIEELKEMGAAEGEEPPSPTDYVDILPF